MKCDGNHPEKNECVFCFAERNSEICIDAKKDYEVCEKHRKKLESKM